MSYDPYQTTSPGVGFYALQGRGYHQGKAIQNPLAVHSMLAGEYDRTETTPLFFGQPLVKSGRSTAYPNYGASAAVLSKSAAITDIGAWSIENFDIAAFRDDVSVAPRSTPGMTISYVSVGSRVPVPVKINATYAATLLAAGWDSTTKLSWDYAAGELIEYDALIGAVPGTILEVSTTSKVINYNVVTDTATFADGAVVLLEV